MEVVERNGKAIALFDESIRIEQASDMLDLMATTWYQGHCVGMVMEKDSLPKDFFTLSSGVAGEILQKFSNYQFKIAIVGDFSSYGSNSLQSFIYECNKGNSVVFVPTVEEGLDRLTR